MRKEAENVLHGAAVQFYEKWKRRADEEPAWAQENPVEIHVKRDDAGEFSIELLPELE